MGLVVVALLAAVVAVRLRGGRLEHLGRLRLRARWLLAAAVLAQVVGALLGGRWHASGLASSALLLTGFLARNRRLSGTGVVALGLGANAVVLAANGAMPVSLAVADRVGADVRAVRDGADPRHEPVDARTRLRLLGDVVPVPLPARPEVVSIGDLLVAAGLARVVVVAAGRRPDRVSSRPR